jgi:hypothetical protein
MVPRLIAIDPATGRQATILSERIDESLVERSEAARLSLVTMAGRSTLFFTTCGSACDRVIALDLPTGERRQVFSAPATTESIHSSRVSPDGRSVAFVVRRRDGMERLARVGVDGNGYRELDAPSLAGEATSRVDLLRWTLDGAALLATRTTSTPGASQSTRNLIRVPIAGGAEQVVLSGSPTATAGAFSVSPDAARAVNSVRERVPSAVWVLGNIGLYLKTRR